MMSNHDERRIFLPYLSIEEYFVSPVNLSSVEIGPSFVLQLVIDLVTL